MSQEPTNERKITRRDVLAGGAWCAAAAASASVFALLARKADAGASVWQLDPTKCVQCGNCATKCVLSPSAVKCVNLFRICGYCNYCPGFFEPQPNAMNSGAENQRCPAGAIKRTFIEEPYYEYAIDESLCIGCGKCVSSCAAFGNGSLMLQVRHDRCVNCNDCSIARSCPVKAYERVPANEPTLLHRKLEAK